MNLAVMWAIAVQRRGTMGIALVSLTLGLSAPARAQPVTVAPSASARAVSPAQGSRRLVVPVGPEQQALSVELASEGLWYRVCADPGCDPRTGRRLDIPAQASVDSATLQIVEAAPGRRLVHVRMGLPDGAWEALVAAGIRTGEARIIFAGLTGPLEGEDGQRQGAMLWLRSDEKGSRVLVGRVQEDVHLCGRPTLLEPRLLDENLILKPAKVQQVSLEERRGARVLGAVRAPNGPTPGGNALRALVASSAVGDPRALTDGRVDTAWSEGRGGEGRGEFVVLRPLADLVSLEFSIRPDGDGPIAGAAPRSIWLLTRGSAFRIDWSEDAWQTPGAWYTVRLPEPLVDDCIALVLEQAYTEQPETLVTFAEVRGVSELQLLEPAELVGRLSTPGEAGAAAVPALLQAGQAGIEAVVGAFAALDAVGRARALDILEDAPCEPTVRIYVGLLVDADARLRRRAERRLRACDVAAAPELQRAFDAASGDAAVTFARALADITPALAVELLGPRLAAAGPEHRSGYRDALSRAVRRPEAAPGLRRLLGVSGLGVAAEIELLRALGDDVVEFRPEASLTFGRAAAQAHSFDQRFLLLGPASRLASSDRGALAFVQRALTDPDVYLRAAAARLVPNVPALHALLLRATRDDGVRVREASALRLGELSVSGAAPVLVERLNDDDWPLVRAAAARSLATQRPALDVDQALAAALRDESPRVRSLALRALGQRGARTALSAMAARFLDTDEEPEVRAAAARALAVLCDAKLLDALTEAVRKLAGDRPSPADMTVGSAALAALGRLAPADLETRLAPLMQVKDQPSVEHLVTLARQTPDRCNASQPAP